MDLSVTKKETSRESAGLRNLGTFLGVLALFSLIGAVVMVFSDAFAWSDVAITAGCALTLFILDFILAGLAVIVEAASRYLKNSDSNE